jgi:PHP family Zn ribbon phosphoesterase
MNTYKADLHLHTVLSPCGDLTMSPAEIVKVACEKGLDIIGVTDHNSTRHVALIKKLAEKEGIFVLGGAEVTTKEEVHCLAFFETGEQLADFQQYLDVHLANIENNPDVFGYQVQVDENEDIVYQEERLLISALDQSINQVEEEVHRLGGLFIPAHIDKQKNSVLSQLGFLPPDLSVDALGLSANADFLSFVEKNKYLKPHAFIQNSDAHIPHEIGKVHTVFTMEHRSFQEVKMACRGENGRKVEIPA